MILNQRDIDHIKAWIIEKVIKDVAKETVKQSKLRQKELMKGEQTASNTYSSTYYITGMERANIRIKANRGLIKGKQVIAIKSSLRRSFKGKPYTIKAHDRTYVDKRLFRKPNGKLLVLDHIPDATMVKLITDSFQDALAERAEFFQGTSQQTRGT